MNTMKTPSTHPDMFHDEAAHRLERRIWIPLAAAVAILALYGLVYGFVIPAF